MIIDDVFKKFVEVRKYKVKQSTIDLYTNLYNRHFSFLKGMEIESLTSNIVDDWLTYMRINKNSPQRLSFDHELTLLKTIVSFYHEQYDVRLDIFRKRHMENCVVKRRLQKLNKELREDEFKLFLEWLSLLYNEKFTMLAIIQYYQALRISEAIAIHYDDIKLDPQNPLNSSLTIQRSVVFSHQSNQKSYIQNGFKNGDVKRQPLIPQVYFYLKDKLEQFKGKYLFIEDGIWPFYSIKNAYNKAFMRANLPYRSTHILRHGGCSRLFNMSGGNVIIASQLLGNSEKETLKTYAHGYSGTLQYFTNSLYLQNEK